MPQMMVSHSGTSSLSPGGDQLAEQADHRAADHGPAAGRRSDALGSWPRSVGGQLRKPTWPAVPSPIST